MGDATPAAARMDDTGPANVEVPLFARGLGKKRNLLGLAESAPGSPTMGPTPGSGMAWHALSAGCATQLFRACDPPASRTTNRSPPVFPRSASPIARSRERVPCVFSLRFPPLVYCHHKILSDASIRNLHTHHSHTTQPHTTTIRGALLRAHSPPGLRAHVASQCSCASHCFLRTRQCFDAHVALEVHAVSLAPDAARCVQM